MSQQPTISANHRAVLETLARQRHAIGMAVVRERTDLEGHGVPNALRSLVALGHVTPVAEPKQPVRYSITTQGRRALGHADDLPDLSRVRKFVGQVAGPACHNVFTAPTYTCPELRTAPPRGAGCMVAFGLPSKGIGQ